MINVTIRRYHKRGILGLEADISIAFPDNRPPYRKRKKIPKAFEGTQKKANDWAMQLAVNIAKEGRPGKKKALPPVLPACPTLGEFVPRYLRQHLIEGGKCKATHINRERDLNAQLLPLFKDTPLDKIDEACFERLRVRLLKTKRGTDRCRRTRNAIPALLYQILELAQLWRVMLAPLPKRPERIKELKPVVEIYSADELSRLIEAARSMGSGRYLAVLLGCEAGLRIGEMAGLNWTDIDLARGVLMVRRQESRPGEVEPPKGGSSRPVPLTDKLKAALIEHRHLSERVLVRYNGSRVQSSTIRCWLQYAEKKAKLIRSLTPHKLRHTFASRVLATGSSLKAVQILLGHASLQSTMCYIHLQPTEAEAAIRRLSGDVAETRAEEKKP